MRILSVATTHPRYLGDSEPSYVLAVNRELVSLGHQVTALLPHAEGAEVSEIVDGVHISRFRYFFPTSLQRLCYNGGILPNLKRSWWARFNLPFFVLAQAFAVARAATSKRYDLIHCHWLITSGLMGAFFAGLGRAPLVVTAHGSDVFTENALFKMLDRFVLGRCCACTVNSKRSGEMVSRINPSARIVPVPMGVYPEKYSKQLASSDVRRKMGNGRPQLLFVGRFSANKGITDLVAAMKSVLKEMGDARLALVGYGPEEEPIRHAISKHGLEDRIILVGRVARAEIPVFMASADLLVLPSIKIEGLGVVLLEALASGTAVVGTDVGGIPDIVKDGETGLLCRSHDPEDLASKCLRLLRDQDLRRRTTENGRKLIEEKFGWSQIGIQFDALFATCTGISSPCDERDGKHEDTHR
jgi:glycosyltransferase involved in cell wall biosynthesis